jgi:hypothetical protein
LVDLDGDGHDDVISGSYWPGDMFWFRGEGRGRYAARQKLKDANGKDLNAGAAWKSEKEYNLESLAAAPHFADLDGDGDFDLLVGNIAGHVVFIPNAGTTTEPKFVGDERRALEAGGKELRVEGDAGPFVVDWDGDGDLDLIVGGGDGAVSYYANVGTRTEARFAAATKLVEARTDPNPIPLGAEPKGPSMRSKVCATDWDGDGRLDLLVGDFAMVAPGTTTPNGQTHGWVWLYRRKAPAETSRK